MRGVIGRALVAAAAGLALVGLPAGVASAAAGPAVLAFQPAPYDFGPVSVGERREQTFSLVNTGGRASGALTFRVSGSAAFTIITDTCPPSLGPGKSCAVSVRFAPTATGTVKAILTAANKRQTVTVTDALTGTGRRLGATLERIYWTSSDGSISVGPLNGSSVTPLVSGQNEPLLLAVGSGFVYWGKLRGQHDQPGSTGRWDGNDLGHRTD